MTTTKRPLCHLWQNAKFVYNGKTYTVYQHEANMTEVYDGKRFWELTQVNWIII